MIFRRFLINVIIQVVLIALAGFLVVWSFSREELVIARFTFVTIWVILIAALIRYVTRTNRTLKTFFESLRYLDDVSTHKGRGKSFEELDKLYNEIIGIVRRVEVDKETERQYFRGIINHIGVGILSFDETGDVEIVNEAFKKLMGIRSVQNVSVLSGVSVQLPELLMKLKPGYQKLLRITINHETVGLSLKMAEFRLQDRRVRLASVQNIQHELEEEELDAWQKLIRVLTHEIMNSVTPVNSLTKTMIRLFEEDGQPKCIQELDETILQNALEGLHSIEKRNKGLISFVQSYRSLTRIRKPIFTDLQVCELLIRIGNLVKQELESRQIRLSVVTGKDDLRLSADEKLVEQVLINLVNNAMYALQNTAKPEILFSARADHNDIIIEVRDNGEGIPPEVMSSIFVPFFTTKEEGSGIGLSLSRQIMRVHGGTITVQSKPGDTRFLLKFSS